MQSIYYDFDSGDLTQYYNQNSAHQRLRAKENQEPILIGGYHHEWQPGIHTLLLAGRLQDRFSVTDPNQSVLILNKNVASEVTGVSVLPSPLDYRSKLEAYTAEAQQIWQNERNTVIAGARYQTGAFDSQSQFERATVSADLQRMSFYAYDHWRPIEPLLFVAGVSYDRLTFPANLRSPPLSDREETKEQVAPKAGVIWTPFAQTTVRGSFARGLGGVSFDQSFRLEPAQVAGFNQSYRSLIPESVTGSIAGERFDTWGLALDQRIGLGTFVGIEAELLESDADRTIGAITATGFPPIRTASGTSQTLNFEEKSLVLTLNQLVGKSWSLGARYRVSEADLNTDFREIPSTLSPGAHTAQEATLHQLRLFANFNHRSGFFGLAETIWSAQSNRGYAPDRPGDDFWQCNVYAGYRFLRRHAEVRLGLLNLTDQDYRLNPLTLYQELPRERTLSASFKFSF